MENIVPVSIDLTDLIEHYPQFRKSIIYESLASELNTTVGTLRRWLKEPGSMPAESFKKLCNIFCIEETTVLPNTKHYDNNIASLVNSYIISKEYDRKNPSPIR